MPPIFVDARDLAERLGVRYDTVLTWVRRGKLPHIRKGRGRYLFNLNTVLETLRQKSLDARHEAAERDGVLASGKLWKGGRDSNSETFR